MCVYFTSFSIKQRFAFFFNLVKETKNKKTNKRITCLCGDCRFSKLTYSYDFSFNFFQSQKSRAKLFK